MRLTQLRSFVLFGQSLSRVALVTATLVAALIIGLLAMHSTSMESSHDNATAVLVETGHAGTMQHASGDAGMTAKQTPTRSDGCSGSCQPEHPAMAMACILALLTATILLIVRTGLGLGELRLTVLWSRLRRRVVGVAPERPPSLIALSISRT